MASEETKRLFEALIRFCVSVYGVDETRAIMREVDAKIGASGLDGAFVRDWFIITKQTAIERNPNSSILWAKINVEKSNALSTH